MKSLSKQKNYPLSFFGKNKRFTSFLSMLLTLAFLNLNVGCSYYNVRNVTTSSETMYGQIEEFNKSQQYAVMHSGLNTWHLNNLVLNEDNQTISGTAQKIESTHTPLKPRDSKRVHRYTRKQSPLNEVHFYINRTNTPDYGAQVTIPFSEISSISVNDKNTGRSVVNVVMGTIGVIAGIFIIILATKSSCPFIYVKDGDEFIFTGELYPGVLTANQQRDDYLQLPSLNENNSDYSILITNELKEIQFTDFVQLLEVDHPKNVDVLLDKNGNPHTFSEIISPKTVMVDNLKMENGPVMTQDNDSYLFNTDTNDSSSIRNIEMTFKAPKQISKAKLFLTVKNSMWLDYAFGRFNEKFGTYYPQFQKDQQKVSKEKSAKWMNEQNIPLSIYIKTSTGWELVDRINTVGPMAFRNIAVPLDLSKAVGGEVVLKLETGFMFWEVDYAGIDFTENVTLDVKYINPYQALDENNENVTQLLASEDQRYFVQPNIGDKVWVNFKTSEPDQDIERSYFLKNRGYYNYIRDYQGDPDFRELKLFRSAGTFTDFSKYEYETLMDFENHFDVVLNTK
ncbi:hypothetical protein [Maribacter arenosus]|uniref:Uncharacterized protein n=1 Tax=Maribacter arenosus TaxID=1854708 RepID=A0ABR7V7X4_9FLAO|nr:hypothetical protein [Maribacter arenosus]MBD0849483.1 hypothetical protein [Maribacter arenosus]